MVNQENSQLTHPLSSRETSEKSCAQPLPKFADGYPKTLENNSNGEEKFWRCTGGQGMAADSPYDRMGWDGMG